MSQINRPIMSRSNDGDCKDFIKGVCFRGNKCKYRHTGEMSEPDTVPFCKDYMNERGCNFENDNGRECSFIHAPLAAVEEYNKTGMNRYEYFLNTTRLISLWSQPNCFFMVVRSECHVLIFLALLSLSSVLMYLVNTL